MQFNQFQYLWNYVIMDIFLVLILFILNHGQYFQFARLIILLLVDCIVDVFTQELSAMNQCNVALKELMNLNAKI